MGTGFSQISRPDHQHHKPFFLQLDATIEALTFDAIGAPIPNRGSEQNDIFFRGVHYFQEISDRVTNGGLHLENGMWLNIPATEAPKAPASVVRISNIPHGDSLLAQGSSLVVSGGPKIEPVSSIPISLKTGKRIDDDDYLEPFRNTPLPPGIPDGAIVDPSVVLREHIKDQRITETTVLTVSTEEEIGGFKGGIENIPFVRKNANAANMTAIFWIEKVQDPDLGEFTQLQYLQNISLDFLDIRWPHIQCATLVGQ
jgi:hypothetical protein